MKRLVRLLILIGAAAYGASDEALVSRYLKYRELIRLTDEQIDMAESTGTLCIDPSSMHGPHLRPGIHLYANAVAIKERQKSLLSHHYPLGTLLVKEKFDKMGGDRPGIITVMEKVADTGKVGDWQFTMIRIADRTVVRDGFRVSCIDCHSRYKKTDFVSRETDSLVAEYAVRGAPKPGARR